MDVFIDWLMEGRMDSLSNMLVIEFIAEANIGFCCFFFFSISFIYITCCFIIITCFALSHPVLCWVCGESEEVVG